MEGRGRLRGTRLRLRARLGLLVLVTAAFALAAVGPARQALGQRRAIAIEEQKLAALRSSNAHLEKELRRLNDKDYLEKAAREQLGVVRPGETAYIVEKAPAPPRPKPPPPPPPPWYDRVWRWLMAKIDR